MEKMIIYNKISDSSSRDNTFKKIITVQKSKTLIKKNMIKVPENEL